jgi:hypothetical protein
MDKASLIKKLLNFGSQTAPEVIEKASPITKRASMEATEVAPEVIGSGARRAAKAADISDANFSEITPTTGMDDMSAWNKLDKKKAAALLGLGGGATAYMLSEEDSSPVVPQAPMKAVEPKKPEEIKAEAKKTVNTEPPKKDGLDFDALAKKFDEGMANLPKEPAAIVDEYELAKEQANRNQLMAILGKAATQIGGGIASLGAGSQVKLDDSGFDNLMKIADRPISQLQEKQKYNSAKAELDDENKMRDPNSEISKMVTGIAQKVGILKPGQSASAMALKNAGVNLGTLLSTIEAGNARRDAAALAREASDSSRRERMDMRAEEDAKKRLDKRKLVTEEIEARKRTIGDNIKRARDLIEQYGTVEATGPEAELLQGILDEIAVDTAKLQDPDSVARPAEVQLVRKNLIPEDTLGRMTMTNDTAKDILDQFEKRINERAATGYKVRGVQQPMEEQSPTDNNSKRKIVNQGGNLFDANTGEFLGKAK